LGVNTDIHHDEDPLLQQETMTDEDLNEEDLNEGDSPNTSHFSGITRPRWFKPTDSVPSKMLAIFANLQWVAEFVFSILRWISIPFADGQWDAKRRWLTIFSPFPFFLLFLIAAEGWDGFSLFAGRLPLYAILLIAALVCSVFMFFTTNSSSIHPTYAFIFSVIAFMSAVVWMNIEANETVAILETLGIAFNIDTAILGLTVLALGNSVGDWVADTTVAKTGKPGMAVAATFGSSLLNDVLGFGIALTAVCVQKFPEHFNFNLQCPEFSQVKITWIFLSSQLFITLVSFPVFKFRPPRWYGLFLIIFYCFFVLISILNTLKIINLFNSNEPSC